MVPGEEESHLSYVASLLLSGSFRPDSHGHAGLDGWIGAFEL